MADQNVNFLDRLKSSVETLKKNLDKSNQEKQDEITSGIAKMNQDFSGYSLDGLDRLVNQNAQKMKEDSNIPPFILNNRAEGGSNANEGETELSDKNPTSTTPKDKSLTTSTVTAAAKPINPQLDKQEKEYELAKANAKLLTKQKVRDLASILKTRVFGQDPVINEVVNILKVAALNLKINQQKPAGCYLFAGPSGVGKTELAQAMADSLNVPILKINMGEYGLEQDVTKLIGTSKGYVGYQEGGLLTNFVKENPACIILFDELEKAHSSIDKILLSTMDHGICTDNKGVEVSFKETIIISTSNLGAEAEYFPDMTKAEKDAYRMNEIKQGLRPEIINRYDSIFHFDSLSPDIYRLVCDKFTKSLAKQIKEHHHFELKFSEKMMNFIVEKSFDPAMGGRPARKFIEKVVTQPLTERMLEDDFEDLVKIHTEVTFDLNKAGNICFKGNRGKVLGVLENTAEEVARIEATKFTNKSNSPSM